MSDERQEAVNRLTNRILQGERLSEDEVADTLYLARDQVLLSVTRNVLSDNFEDMTSVECITLDKTGSGKKTYRRKDIMRMFNVLQNAVERHELRHKTGEDPMAAMEAVWQTVADRAIDRHDP